MGGGGWGRRRLDLHALDDGGGGGVEEGGEEGTVELGGAVHGQRAGAPRGNLFGDGAAEDGPEELAARRGSEVAKGGEGGGGVRGVVEDGAVLLDVLRALLAVARLEDGLGGLGGVGDVGGAEGVGDGDVDMDLGRVVPDDGEDGVDPCLAEEGGGELGALEDRGDAFPGQVVGDDLADVLVAFEAEGVDAARGLVVGVAGVDGVDGGGADV